MRDDQWEIRFFDAVASAHSEPFEWGKTDCARFMLRCAAAVRGSEDFTNLPRWKDKAGALKAIAKAGSLSACMAKVFDALPSALAAQRGDVGVVEIDGVQSAVVCIGNGWIGKSETGVITMPLASAVAAFKV